MPSVATVSAAASRDQLLWDEEVARARARRGTMSPAAAAAVRSVLRALVVEAREERVVLSAVELLEELGERATPARAQRVRILWSGAFAGAHSRPD